MTSVAVTWSGVDAARDAARRWGLVARNRVRQAVHDSASDMAVTIAGGAPVLTGALADSIQVDHEVDSFDTWGAATVYTSLVYARRVEMGFHGADSLGRVYSQQAQPFFSTGFHASAPGFESRVRAALIG